MQPSNTKRRTVAVRQTFRMQVGRTGIAEAMIGLPVNLEHRVGHFMEITTGNYKGMGVKKFLNSLERQDRHESILINPSDL